MRFCHTCGLWPQAVAEQERELQLELMMNAALEAGADPLAYAVTWDRARFHAPASVLAHWAVARLFLRLRYGAALYDSMPAKLRSA